MSKVQDSVHKGLSWFNFSKTQAIIILCGVYIFLSFAGNIAATKVTYFGQLVMDD